MAKIEHVKAKHLHAGHRLVVTEGTVKKYRRICELHVNQTEVKAMYITNTGFETKVFKPMHRVKIRVS